MTRRQEKTLIEALEEIYSEVHENNIILHQICDVINFHHARHHQENEDDFGRNVLANLLSGMVNLRDMSKRR